MVGRKNLNNETIGFSDVGDPANTGELQRNGDNLKFRDSSGVKTLVKAEATPDLIPAADDTYWLGEIGGSYKAYKGVILKDTADGKHYKVVCTNGSLVVTALD